MEQSREKTQGERCSRFFPVETVEQSGCPAGLAGMPSRSVREAAVPHSAARGQHGRPARRGDSGPRTLLAETGGGRPAAPSLIGCGAGAAMLAETVPPVPWKLAVAAATASVGAASCCFSSLVSWR